MLHRLIGWLVLAIALCTYLLTLEPTVSYWDCPEYVTCAYGMQPGHPPGNPIWMLTARFFITLAPDITYAAWMVNAMSGVCAALTVLLTYLTTVLLARHILPEKRVDKLIDKGRFILQHAAGIVAGLALCWSDSFWFSAVEAEVYAFSSLTTALLFWLTLVWSGQAFKPHADRYLVAIAYILGLSIGVHELNLLCLPALLLLMAFRLNGFLTKKKIAGIIMLAIIAIGLVLYGLIPGFISLCARMEMIAVNQWGLPYNSGTIIWWALTMMLIALSVGTLHLHGSRTTMLESVGACSMAIAASGLFFFSGNVFIGVSLTLIMAFALAWQAWHGLLNIRRLRIAMWGIAMMILGFSSYGVIIIRSNARPPLNTGAPADIFAFSRYFSREQYGKSPLIYGPTFTAQPQRVRTWSTDEHGNKQPHYSLYRLTGEKPQFQRAIPGMKAIVRSGFGTAADSAANARVLSKGHGYVLATYTNEYAYAPEQCMWFPRMHSHSPADISGYPGWSGADTASMLHMDKITVVVDSAGRPVENMREKGLRPTYAQNIAYLFGYQLGYMYWRYFLWNFVGRQNDWPGHGEADCGNFITGVDAIDDAMLDNVSGAPAEIGRGNKGRNVYYFLPLLLGILGIVAQCRSGVRGRRQALVIAVLFIVTGMAIVFYLNQGPAQARDRDYSFAGSFYAWTMWMGLGVLGLWQLLKNIKKIKPAGAAWLASALGLIVPLQMLSQTADDHDRSGRTVTRDMVRNQLALMEPDALIFAAEDNYIFPLLYQLQVESDRKDVRLLTLPYMATDWYASQLYLPMRNGSKLPVTAPEGLIASPYMAIIKVGNDTTRTDALTALKTLYAKARKQQGPGYVEISTPRLYIPMQDGTIELDLRKGGSYLRRENLLTIDLLATNAARPNPRPVYVITTVAPQMLNGQLAGHLQGLGSISKIIGGDSYFDAETIADKALSNFGFGGAENKAYFDPIAARNLSIQRRALIKAADSLANNPKNLPRAIELLKLVEKKMPASVVPFDAVTPEGDSGYTTEGFMMARAWSNIGRRSGNKNYLMHGEQIRKKEIQRIAAIKKWRKTLRPQFQKYTSYRVDHLIDALDAELLKNEE